MMPVSAYRIGWWTHRWWPRAVILRCLVTGRQPDGRRVPRSRYVQTITRDLRKIRRPHRPWQAEMTLPNCSCNARRAFTRAGAEKRAMRLHEKRVHAPVVDGTPVSGVKGVCWLALTDAQREACV